MTEIQTLSRCVTVECSVMHIFRESYNAQRSIEAMNLLKEALKPRPAGRAMSQEEIAADKREIERWKAERLDREAGPNLDLTLLQQIALLRMMDYSNAGSTLARGVAKHLQSDCQDKPSFRDYRALMDIGLCTKPEGDDWHRHTPRGVAYAQRLALKLARQFNLHVFREGGRSGASQDFSCTCGKWSGNYYNSRNGANAAYLAWSRHVSASSPTCEAESA